MDRQFHRDKEGRGQERESKEHKNGMTWVCSSRKLVTDKITEKNGVSCVILKEEMGCGKQVEGWSPESSHK